MDLADQIAVRRKVYQDRDRCVMLEGDALNGEWTKKIPKSDMYIIVMEGVLEYFSKEQVRTCLNMLCDSFPHGFLLAELHCPFMEKNSKHHDAVKYTKASFGWGTKSGKEYVMIVSKNGQKGRIIFEPNEKMVEDLFYKAPRKVVRK